MALRRKRKTDDEATVAPEAPEAESPAATATPSPDEPAEVVEAAPVAERRPTPTHDDEW